MHDALARIAARFGRSLIDALAAGLAMLGTLTAANLITGGELLTRFLANPTAPGMTFIAAFAGAWIATRSLMGNRK